MFQVAHLMFSFAFVSKVSSIIVVFSHLMLESSVVAAAKCSRARVSLLMSG